MTDDTALTLFCQRDEGDSLALQLDNDDEILCSLECGPRTGNVVLSLRQIALLGNWCTATVAQFRVPYPCGEAVVPYVDRSVVELFAEGAR